MGTCKSKHTKISVLNNTFGNLLYFNVLNYVNLYFHVKTIDDVKNNVYKYKSIEIDTHSIIIIVIKKNKNLITTIWCYDNSNMPYNIIETHIHMSERELDLYLNDFTKLLMENKVFEEIDQIY